MKTGVEDIVDRIEERTEPYYMDEMTPEEFTTAVLNALVEEELPHLQEELERFDSKKYTTIGKVEFLEEIREVTR